MALFGKKKEKTPSPEQVSGLFPPEGAGNGVPMNTISNLQQQGLSNDQIIQELQNEGYNSQEIFDALNNVDTTNIPGSPIDDSRIGQGPSALDQPPMDMGAPVNDAPNMGAPAMNNPVFNETKENIEEMAEAIIDEKWEELVKSINKIIEWKDKIEGRLTKIEQDIQNVKENFSQLHSSVIGKINEYDKNIVNVGTEVKAMGKVFEKVLPTFTENVNELKRVVKDSKK
jgi:hypothetical protein